MSNEKIQEVIKAIDRLADMDAYSKGIMAGYILCVKENKERNKNWDHEKYITKIN